MLQPVWRRRRRLVRGALSSPSPLPGGWGAPLYSAECSRIRHSSGNWASAGHQVSEREVPVMAVFCRGSLRDQQQQSRGTLREHRSHSQALQKGPEAGKPGSTCSSLFHRKLETHQGHHQGPTLILCGFVSSSLVFEPWGIRVAPWPNPSSGKLDVSTKHVGFVIWQRVPVQGVSGSGALEQRALWPAPRMQVDQLS